MSKPTATKEWPGALEPCPYCGNRNPVEEELIVGFVFRCMNFDCPVRPTTRPCRTQAEAAAAWNQRAPGTAASPGDGLFRVLATRRYQCQFSVAAESRRAARDEAYRRLGAGTYCWAPVDDRIDVTVKKIGKTGDTGDTGDASGAGEKPSKGEVSV